MCFTKKSKTECLKKIMRSVMSWIRIFGINVVITIIFIVVIEITFSLALSIRDKYFTNEASSLIGPNVTSETIGFRQEAKNFRGYPYKAFLGWTSPNITGDFLNVANGRRKTVVSGDIVGDTKLHFFGGSTMWGHSVSDKNTIPSLVSQSLKLGAVNYGEQAYNSRQGLNLLLDNLETIKKGDVVVFYDGVNDIYHNCRSYNSPNGHAREFYIRAALNREIKNGNIAIDVIKNLSTYQFMKGLSQKFFPANKNQGKDYRNSCNDDFYAGNVAQFLVKNWETAQALLESREVNFICILQPNPYTLDGPIAYSSEEIKSQIESVYPLIRKKGRGLSCFEDYSSVLTEDNYVDTCCHLNEYGNSELATKVSADISRKLRSVSPTKH
jgi:hypothetical protein